ncbi:DUF7535 family protein [Natribaculum luteum]|nr:hypothetical protein [Natribaculum luteum]
MSRTVTGSNPYGPTVEMSIIGYLIVAGIAVVLLPVLPFLLAVWLVVRIASMGPERESSTPERVERESDATDETETERQSSGA